MVVDNQPAARGLTAGRHRRQGGAGSYRRWRCCSSTFTTSAAVMNTLQYDPLKPCRCILLARGLLLVTVIPRRRIAASPNWNDARASQPRASSTTRRACVAASNGPCKLQFPSLRLLMADIA